MTMQLEMEVPIGRHTYRISRMSVFEQMNVAADCRDILVGLAFAKSGRPKDMSDADFNKGVQFIIASRGGMTPEIRERVMNVCFGHVTRHAGVGWQPILATLGTMQFDDIQLLESITLLYASFEHNKLIDFFGESPSSSDGQTDEEESGQNSQTGKTG